MPWKVTGLSQQKAVGLFSHLGGSLTCRLSEERSPSPSRDHGPTLNCQGSHTTPLNWKTSCSAAPQSGHLLGTVGKQSTTFRRKLWRNTVQHNIDSHGPVTDRQNEFPGWKETYACISKQNTEAFPVLQLHFNGNQKAVTMERFQFSN